MITLQLKTERCPPDAKDIFFADYVPRTIAERQAARAGYRFFALCPYEYQLGKQQPSHHAYFICEVGIERAGGRITGWSWLIWLARVVSNELCYAERIFIR